jgi:hypothetical protein
LVAKKVAKKEGKKMKNRSAKCCACVSMGACYISVNFYICVKFENFEWFICKSSMSKHLDIGQKCPNKDIKLPKISQVPLARAIMSSDIAIFFFDKQNT